MQSGHTEGPKNVKDYPHKKKETSKKTDKITQNYIKRRFELDFRG
jgi:hypothetical protein